MKQVQLEAFLGGNANNGANCGPRYANTNNRTSNANANNGFRLIVNYYQNCISLALAKIANINAELVSH